MSAEEEQLAVGKLVCRHVGRPQPWRATVSTLRDGSLQVSVYHADNMQPPSRWIVIGGGEVIETTNLD